MSECKRMLLPVVALAIGCANGQPAWGQDAALQFRGSEAIVSPVDVWTGDGWFSIGQAPPLHATILVFGGELEKSDGDTWVGIETATLDFGDGDELQFFCRFVSEYVTSAAGVSRYSSTCNVTGGKGIFQKASGIISENASYGPGMSFPGMTPDGNTWYCTGEFTGVILGVDPKAIAHKLTMKAANPSQVRTVLRHR